MREATKEVITYLCVLLAAATMVAGLAHNASGVCAEHSASAAFASPAH